MNGRPLTYISDDVTGEEQILSPYKLVFGRFSNQEKTTLDFSLVNNQNDVVKNRFLQRERYYKHFERLFYRDYLPTLRHRSKWTSQHPPIPINTLVLVEDSRFAKKNYYPLGRIIEQPISKLQRTYKVQIRCPRSVEIKNGKVKTSFQSPPLVLNKHASQIFPLELHSEFTDVTQADTLATLVLDRAKNCPEYETSLISMDYAMGMEMSALHYQTLPFKEVNKVNIVYHYNATPDTFKFPGQHGHLLHK